MSLIRLIFEPRYALVLGKFMKKPKSIPAFKSEAEERRFWQTHDSTDYIDWSKAERMRFPNLKPDNSDLNSSAVRFRLNR